MIDLHVHLPGSIRVETLLELAIEQDAYLPAYDLQTLQNEMHVPKDCTYLRDVVERYRLIETVLQDRKSIKRVTYELVRQLDKQGVLYAEIRLSPQFHTLRGLSQSMVVDAAVAGLKRGIEDSKNIRANLLLCTIRGADEKDNFETIVEAEHYLGKGVAGIDLDGSEAQFSTSLYEEQIRLIRMEEIPFTMHAGISAGADSIREALRLGVKRIGHCVRAREDEGIIEELEKRGILLEMCPTANLKNHAVKDIWDFPIMDYYNRGIKVCANSDNLLIYDTNVVKEYNLLQRTFGITKEQIYQMNLNALEGAFISRYEKMEIKQLLDTM